MTKPTKKKPTKRVKAGTSKQSSKERKEAFAYVYIANGRNGLQAAISVGCPAKGAGVTASRWLKDANVKKLIDEATTKAAAIAGLTVERTLKEVARLAYADVRKLYDDRGELIPVHELDEDTAATVASIEVDEEYTGRGKSRKSTGRVKKIKIHSKTQALEMAMKHHKLYDEGGNTGTTIINKIYYGDKK